MSEDIFCVIAGCFKAPGIGIYKRNRLQRRESDTVSRPSDA